MIDKAVTTFDRSASVSKARGRIARGAIALSMAASAVLASGVSASASTVSDEPQRMCSGKSTTGLSEVEACLTRGSDFNILSAGVKALQSGWVVIDLVVYRNGKTESVLQCGQEVKAGKSFGCESGHLYDKPAPRDITAHIAFTSDATGKTDQLAIGLG